MSYLGEYEKENGLVLELTTKKRDFTPVLPDEQPVFRIEYCNKNGLFLKFEHEMKLVEVGRYRYYFLIPNSFEYGDYLITYEVKINGKKHNAKERFKVSEKIDLMQESVFQNEQIKNILGNPEKNNTLYNIIMNMKTDVEKIKERLSGKVDPSLDVKIMVTSENLLMPDGKNTAIYYNKKPLKGAKVEAFIREKTQKIFINSAITNESGKWKMELLPREYIFEFSHPNGMRLFNLIKEV